MDCQSKWNATQNGVSLKIKKITESEISLKIICHWNVTGMSLKKKKKTENKMSFKKMSLKIEGH